MKRRSPCPAPSPRTLPALASLVAAATLPACEGPRCADDRAGELEHHGRAGAGHVARREPLAALRELAVALGIARHPAARVTEPLPQITGGVPAPVTDVPALPTPSSRPYEPHRLGDFGAVGPAPPASALPPRGHRG